MSFRIRKKGLEIEKFDFYGVENLFRGMKNNSRSLVPW